MGKKPRPGESESQDTILVSSQLTPTGQYIAMVSRGDHHIATLHPTVSRNWVAAWLRHLADARHDAAIVKQMREAGIDGAPLHKLLTDFRTRRGTVPRNWTGPITVTPIVSASTGAPILRCKHPGVGDWQWTVPEAESHVMDVLTVMEAARLDNVYYGLLIHEVDLDAPTARGMVSSLGEQFPRD